MARRRAIVFWWPVVNPAPRMRRPASFGGRLVYVVLAAFQGAAAVLVLLMRLFDAGERRGVPERAAPRELPEP